MSESEMDTEVSEIEQVTEKQEFDGFINFDKWDEVKPEQVRERLDRETRIKREQERKLQTESEARKKLEKELLELRKPKEVQPPSEDLWIRDPDQAKQQQDEYLQSRDKAKDWEFEQKQFEERQKAETLQQQQERVGRFHTRAQKAGIDQARLGMALNVAIQSLPENMQGYLAEHDYGPQMIVRLAENPMEMQELASLSPYEAGVKLDRMAQAYKAATTSKAPPPDDPVKGLPTADNPYGNLLKGAKFL